MFFCATPLVLLVLLFGLMCDSIKMPTTFMLTFAMLIFVGIAVMWWKLQFYWWNMLCSVIVIGAQLLK